MSYEVECRILDELKLIRTQLDVLAKLRTRDRVTGQELRRAREKAAKFKAERDVARKLFARLEEPTTPIDYDTLKQHSHKKRPQ